MKQCPRCSKNFPAHLIQTMFTSNGNFVVCPICALQIKNEVHGLNDNAFVGKKANKMLIEARKFLKRQRRTRHDER